MFADAFASALGNVFSAVYSLAAVFVYISLVRQIHARKAQAPTVPALKIFGLPEVILAAALIGFLLLNVVAAITRTGRAQLSSHDLIANLFFIIAVVLVIGGLLRLRRFDLDSLAGFSRMSFVRSASTGIILLFFTYPLLAVAESIVQALFGAGSSRQEIIELFNGSRTLEQRILIVFLAVAIAPIAEEFIFRLFLYGVFRRYLGVTLALVLNALIFAAVHTHLPSFAPLFVLGACFTLAYEWSGSILVSMTMHALFNGVQLIVLAFPQFVSQ